MLLVALRMNSYQVKVHVYVCVIGIFRYRFYCCDTNNISILCPHFIMFLFYAMSNFDILHNLQRQ